MRKKFPHYIKHHFLFIDCYIQYSGEGERGKAMLLPSSVCINEVPLRRGGEPSAIEKEFNYKANLLQWHKKLIFQNFKIYMCLLYYVPRHPSVEKSGAGSVVPREGATRKRLRALTALSDVKCLRRCHCECFLQTVALWTIYGEEAESMCVVCVFGVLLKTAAESQTGGGMDKVWGIRRKSLVVKHGRTLMGNTGFVFLVKLLVFTHSLYQTCPTGEEGV